MTSALQLSPSSHPKNGDKVPATREQGGKGRKGTPRPAGQARGKPATTGAGGTGTGDQPGGTGTRDQPGGTGPADNQAARGLATNQATRLPANQATREPCDPRP